MKSFEVLDRNLNVHKNYFLEASAGTGKTFSIENVVVRLLVEKEGVDLEKILVVTFTNAATRDLKARIRSNIEKTINFLNNPSETTPDYLAQIMEMGEAHVAQAKKNLDRALLCFDNAQIFTIHSFCARMLNEHVFEGNVKIDAISIDDPLPRTKILAIIRDFFRTGIFPQDYCEGELKLVLKQHQGDLQKLEKSLLETITKGIDIEEVPTLTSKISAFQGAMSELKKEYGITSEKILDDFYSQVPFYKGLCNVKKQVKPEIVGKVTRFAQLFDKEAWDVHDFNVLLEDQLFLTKALDDKNLSLKGQAGRSISLHIKDLPSILHGYFSKIISPTVVFARMARDCQKLFRKHLEQEEQFGFDDILRAMKKGIERPEFLQVVQSKYKAAIIDEFQDTDPLQWQIFQLLFLEKASSWSHLYLVGDPKQSIYAFRQADIYTYLSASQKMGMENHASLDTNYRSQPSLIKALNTLFADRTTPGWMSLPSENKVLSYLEVKTPKNASERKFSDNRGSIHFYVAEDDVAWRLSLDKLEKDYFLPFMVQEIQRLSKEDGVSFDQFAVLVADRFQATRTADYFKSYHIPTVTQRSASLTESPAWLALLDMLKGVLFNRQGSFLKLALGGKIIRWTHDQIRGLEDQAILEKTLFQFHELRRILYSNGFPSFYQHLLQTCWHEDHLTVLERLLSQEDSAEFYTDLQQIAEILFERENHDRLTPEGLLEFLVDYKTLSLNEDKELMRLLEPSKQAVNIMTLHASKGLEFDIVFTLGLLKRTKPAEQLIPVRQNERRVLVPVTDKTDPHYKAYCLEVDAEKMRQLYVAMTRAKLRLYSPVAIMPKSKTVELGSASPMDLFMGRLAQPQTSPAAVYARIKGYDGSVLRKFLGNLPEGVSITYTWLNETPSILTSIEEKTEVQLEQPNIVSIPGTEKFIHSFTSLSSVMETKRISKKPPHDFFAAEKTPHTLPSGSETGTLLHKCLEKFPFSKANMLTGSSDVHSIIQPHLRGTKYTEWDSVIAEIVYNAMTTPLQAGLRLADISPKKCFRETEFLYGSDVPKAPGYLKGFIDLVFEHGDKYYLLDWKSNWLGPECCDYREENLVLAMKEHDYFLQAQLYTNALRRYLHLVDPRPFEEIFGGVFYVFLRGLGNQEGVFYLDK